MGHVEAPDDAAPVVRDASAATGVAVIADAAIVAPTPPAPPRIPVTIAHSVLQSCGDGEELNMPGRRCEAVPGLEPALRVHLAQLGRCPAAEAAAADPTAVLSIGLRVDFPRRRVTALPGRSSSVHSALTFVPCARDAVEHADELWHLTAQHPRYLYFFSVHFGPAPSPRVSAAAVVATRSPTPAATPGLSAPTPAVPTMPAATPRDADDVQVVWDHVLIREAPHDGAIIGHLARGTAVHVMGHHGAWWQVRWSGGAGWIYGPAIDRR